MNQGQESYTTSRGGVFRRVLATIPVREHYVTTTGPTVQVFPPSEGVEHWIVVWPGSKNEETVREMSGECVEQRAFELAEIWAGNLAIRAEPTRVEYGHTWKWMQTPPHADHWRSTSGNCVRVFPPVPGYCTACNPPGGTWWVAVYDKPDTPARRSDVRSFNGEGAEQRAFAAAEAYVRQDRSTSATV